MMRILHVNNQASVGYLLSRSQREMGHGSDLLAVGKFHERRPDHSANGVSGLYIKLLQKAIKYDLIHVHGGIGISGLGLLPYRYLLGKRFFAHYHGSELRGNIQNSFHFMAERIFISTPDLQRYRNNVGGRELIHMPNPVFVDGVEPVDWQEKMKRIKKGGPLKIAHLPTVRKTKGTRSIIDAVDRINEDQKRIELDIIEGTEVTLAMKRLESADICIDWMSEDHNIHGVVSVEAMLRKIPTICNIERAIYPADIPIIDVRPEGLVDKLEEIIRDPSSLPDIGEDSRKYALKHHHPDMVAKLLERYI